MKIYDLTPTELKRAAVIKEQIDALDKELRAILGEPSASRRLSKKSRGMKAATKKKIAAAQKKRWAKLRRSKPTMQ